MGVKSISFGSPYVRPMGRTCGAPKKIKNNTHPKNITAPFVALNQGPVADNSGSLGPPHVLPMWGARMWGELNETR